jgi:hypothetical protein
MKLDEGRVRLRRGVRATLSAEARRRQLALSTIIQATVGRLQAAGHAPKLFKVLPSSAGLPAGKLSCTEGAPAKAYAGAPTMGRRRALAE